jgi:hypothetical protein
MGATLVGVVRPRKSITKFLFIPLIPGTPKDDNKAIHFDAHIISIDDSNAPSYTLSNDMGRADPKIFYAGYQRSIAINFIVVSLTEEEHTSNFIKLRNLALLTYPIYNGSRLGYNSPHVAFTIGNLLNLYGYVENVNYTWNSDTPWIDEKPVITEVNLAIGILGNYIGKRPEYQNGEYKHFTGEL